MVRRWVVFCIGVIFVATLSGCATTVRKQKDMEIQGLRNQISLLESQVQSKDEEINNLKDELSKSQTPAPQVSVKSTKRVKIIPEVKSRPNVKQVQIALRNAGYDPGRIDGHMGKQTKDALKAFQRANNLHADGKAGKQTWRLLRGYLYKQVK